MNENEMASQITGKWVQRGALGLAALLVVMQFWSAHRFLNVIEKYITVMEKQNIYFEIWRQRDSQRYGGILERHQETLTGSEG